MAQCSSPSIDNRRQAANMLLGFAAMLVVGDWVLSRTVWPHLYDSRNGCRWKWDLLTREPQPPEVLFPGMLIRMVRDQPPGGGAGGGESRWSTDPRVQRGVVGRERVTTYLMARRIVEEGRKPAIAYVGVSPAVLDVAAQLVAKRTSRPG